MQHKTKKMEEKSIMVIKNFVEELVKEIGKETGLRVEFCAADERGNTGIV